MSAEHRRVSTREEIAPKTTLVRYHERPVRLFWEATISDTNVWTRPFTLRYPYKLDPEYKVYEYACHEGNYMMLRRH